MSLRQLAAKRPVLAALACAGLQFLLTILILKAGRSYAPPPMFGKIKLVAFASTIIYPLVLAQVLGLWGQLGLGLDKLRLAPFFLVSLLSGAVFISMGFHANEPGGLGGTLLIQFFNAFGEELLFRGVIFALLLALPMWQAILLNGIVFGSMHLIHGFMDASWSSAMSHALLTIPAGMMFVAVRYRTGSLWLCVALHMILNMCIIYSNVEPAAGPAVYFAVQRLANVIELALVAYALAMQGARRHAAVVAAHG
jgi:membrane protease YdiL (CAAX protease family)